MSWKSRKEERKVNYDKYVKGWKEVNCTACSGSGYYDNNGSPKCSSCNGTGRMKVSPEDYYFYSQPQET